MPGSLTWAKSVYSYVSSRTPFPVRYLGFCLSPTVSILFFARWVSRVTNHVSSNAAARNGRQLIRPIQRAGSRRHGSGKNANGRR